MALSLKPHSVTVVPAEHIKDAEGVVVGTEYDGGTARNVQITPLAASVAFERFGLEAKKPHLLLDDVDGAELYAVGDRVTFSSRTFAVAAEPMVWDAEPTTSCIEVALEEV